MNRAQASSLNSNTAASATEQESASLNFDPQAGRVVCTGVWRADRLAGVERKVVGRNYPVSLRPVEIDGSDISDLDTAGALLLLQLQQHLTKGNGYDVPLRGLRNAPRKLLRSLSEQGEIAFPKKKPRPGLLLQLGRKSFVEAREIIEILSFFGRLIFAVRYLFRHPRRLRLPELFQEMRSAGREALPIIGLLSFLIGLVIAYQGGMQLAQYGANIFIVDLVGLAIVRELAPLMTAIMVAGRTGSAYTAEIGSMKLSEEIDALQVIGLEPLELLALPKLLGLIIVLPLLTVFADIMGIFGGMFMANSMLGVTPMVFWERLPKAISLTSYLIGIGKAPVFAAIIAIVGCYQGFTTSGSAEILGRKTTTSVVQSIFLIIISDAAFSIMFSWLKI
ncbi:MAG: ABC transporter permease [Deltaproteobacteria bacterium]|nr:ABC transporter permease [Deltaproteobacteria bacterium]